MQQSGCPGRRSRRLVSRHAAPKCQGLRDDLLLGRAPWELAAAVRSHHPARMEFFWMRMWPSASKCCLSAPFDLCAGSALEWASHHLCPKQLTRNIQRLKQGENCKQATDIAKGWRLPSAWSHATRTRIRRTGHIEAAPVAGLSFRNPRQNALRKLHDGPR